MDHTYINNETGHTPHQYALVVSPGYKITEVPQNVICISTSKHKRNTFDNFKNL